MCVCLMHGYIFLMYVYLLNKDECWEIHHLASKDIVLHLLFLKIPIDSLN